MARSLKLAAKRGVEKLTTFAVDGETIPLGVLVSTTVLDKRETRIRQMFGAIAPWYDTLNHLLSLNIDRSWRKRVTKLVPPNAEAPILDVCTGTGDLALAYDKASGGKLPIVGVDFCPELLARAKEKTRKRK